MLSLIVGTRKQVYGIQFFFISIHYAKQLHSTKVFYFGFI